MNKYFYAIYKGDHFINLFETINEVANFLNVKIETAKFYTSPTMHRRNKRNGIAVYKYLKE